MTNDENWALEGFKLFREPLELLLPDVRRITTFVVFRLLVGVEDDDTGFADSETWRESA